MRLEAARQVYYACLGEPKSEAWEAWRAAFGAVRQRFQFSEYGLHAYAKQFGHSWLGDHLDSHVVQKVATRAFKAVLRFGAGRAGRPRFKGKIQIDSLEGKSNKTGIMWRDGQVQWKGLVMHRFIPGNPIR